MSPLRSTARPMLAAIFVIGGLEAARHPETKVAKAGPVVASLSRRFGLPDDPKNLVRANGAIQVAAGVAMAAGVLPRLSALALAGSLVPTTLAGHPFWDEHDAATRVAQRTQFLKNAAIFGGLVLAVAG